MGNENSPVYLSKYVLAFLLLVMVVFLAGCGASAPPVSEEEKEAVYNLVEWNYYYAQAENLDGYMATLHDSAPGRSSTRDMMKVAMNDFDLEYRILEWELLSIDDDSAKVRVLQLTRKIRGDQPFRDNQLEVVHHLKKASDGQWKIYSSDFKDVEYLN